jgi:two-component system NtrC family sensor kinase
MNENRRILIVDDLPSIHEDFRRVFGQPAQTDGLSRSEALLFGAPAATRESPYELDCASQGQEALQKVVRALAESRPYALAIVDMRMPPGWDGVETIEHLWREDPHLQVAICTAFSDVSQEEASQRLATHQQLVVLHKPFDAHQALRLAQSLIARWHEKQAGPT